MKRFYHQEKIQITAEDKYKEYEFLLDIPNVYGFNYYQELDNQIKSFFHTIPDSQDPTLFRIKGNFDLLKDADKEEKLYFIIAVINIFVSHMIKKDDLEREARLAPPKSIDKLNLNLMTKKAIVNKEIKFPIFAVEVIDLKNKIVYEVFENENISSNTN